jgi:hypothetical protein
MQCTQTQCVVAAPSARDFVGGEPKRDGGDDDFHDQPPLSVASSSSTAVHFELERPPMG